MKKNLLIIFVLFYSISVFSQNLNVQWGVQSDIETSGRACAIDNQNNVLLTGLLENDTTRGIFISKYNSIGELIWSNQFNSGGPNDGGYSIVSDSDNNIIVVGSYRDTLELIDTVLISHGVCDLFILKYTSEGDLIWAKSEGGDSWDRAYSVAIGYNDEIFITGYFIDNANFSGTNIYAQYDSDFFAAKYSPEGQLVWVKHYGGNESGFSNRGNSIKLDNENNVYIAGRFGGFIDIEGNQFVSDGIRDAFLLKLNSYGELSWVKYITSDSYWDNGYSIALDNLNNIYLTSNFHETITIDNVTIETDKDHPVLIAKFTNEGNLLWMNYVPYTAWSSGDRYNYEVVVNNPNNVYMFGTNKINSNEYQMFMSKFDENGNSQWFETYSGKGDSHGNFVLKGSNNEIYLVGDFIDSLVVDDYLAYSEVLSYYLLKMDDLTYNPNYTAINGPKLNKLKAVVSIEPNPVINNFKIKTNLNKEYNFVIFNEKGEKIFEGHSSLDISDINISDLNPGVYILKLFFVDIVLSEKFVKI